jgi:tetrahydromethanopterin S-methyltransferase subunit A
VDMIGCDDSNRVVTRIKDLTSGRHTSCSKMEFTNVIKPLEVKSVEVVQAEKSRKVVLDEAGYFVILPLSDRGIISAEHYSPDNRLLRVIEGKNSSDIYKKIIKDGWVTELSHAAYLGKELARAELSMELGFKYVQDGA